MLTIFGMRIMFLRIFLFKPLQSQFSFSPQTAQALINEIKK